MKKSKTTKGQSASDKVTAYELATLASRIYSEHRADPEAATAAAKKLFDEARYALARQEAEDKKNEEWQDENDKWLESPEDWVRGIKSITGEKRRDRATRRFAKFMEGTGQDINLYKRDRFKVQDVMLLEHEFRQWREQPKLKKGKQGRRISEHDGRLRIGSLRLIPTKPRGSA
jgi:hypothetical protein